MSVIKVYIRGTFSINKAMHILYSFYEQLNTRRTLKRCRTRKIFVAKTLKPLETSTNGKKGWQRTLDGFIHPRPFFSFLFSANETICTSNINRNDLRKAMIMFVGVVSITLAVTLQYHYIVTLSKSVLKYKPYEYIHYT